MISLPGLLLAMDRFEDAKGVLKAFALRCKRGLVPNFVGHGEAGYNSVDASLWFFYAVHKYLSYTGDMEFVEKLWPKLRDILRAYARGVEVKGEGIIRADDDGLISAGSRDTQLTWMDARIWGRAVTPRDGKAVEINALWYNALKTAELLSEKLGEDASTYGRLAQGVRESFNAFWNPDKKCLYDVIDKMGKDASVRPNQIFAVSLPFRILKKGKEKRIVSRVREDLLTPYGLRSLSPRESGYVGVYMGDQARRDLAYHQGTVWSWLLGPYVTAFLRTEGYSRDGRRKAEELLKPLLGEHIRKAGLGTISEIFDGDAPHTPRGCISQAWSVGELLRCYVEDVLLERPEYEEDWL